MSSYGPGAKPFIGIARGLTSSNVRNRWLTLSLFFHEAAAPRFDRLQTVRMLLLNGTLFLRCFQPFHVMGLAHSSRTGGEFAMFMAAGPFISVAYSHSCVSVAQPSLVMRVAVPARLGRVFTTVDGA